MPLRAIYRHALERDEVIANPTTACGCRTASAAATGRVTAARRPSCSPRSPSRPRPLWATAFYAGLRRGELRGLRWDDVDLADGVIRVGAAGTTKQGEIEPKSEKGTGTVPIPAAAAGLPRRAQGARPAATGDDFVFGATADRPFTPTHIRRQAAKAWAAANEKRGRRRSSPPLVPIGLHECRHTFVTLMHDAGFTLERIGDYVGHSSTYMTDRYRHLLEGHETEAARMLDDYLARADIAGQDRAGRRLRQKGGLMLAESSPGWRSRLTSWSRFP